MGAAFSLPGASPDHPKHPDNLDNPNDLKNFHNLDNPNNPNNSYNPNKFDKLNNSSTKPNNDHERPLMVKMRLHAATAHAGH